MYPLHWAPNYWQYHLIIALFGFGKSYCQRKKRLRMLVVRWCMNMKVYFVCRLFHTLLKSVRAAWSVTVSAQTPETGTLQTQEYTTARVSSRNSGLGAVPCQADRGVGEDRRSLSDTAWSQLPSWLFLLLLQRRGSLVKELEAQFQVQTQSCLRDSKKSAEEMELHLLLPFHEQSIALSSNKWVLFIIYKPFTIYKSQYNLYSSGLLWGLN